MAAAVSMRWSRAVLLRPVVAALVAILAMTTVLVATDSASAETTSTVAGIPGVCAEPTNPRIEVDSEGNQAAAWYCFSTEGTTVTAAVQFSRSIAGGAWSTAQTVIQNAIGPSRGPQLALHDGRALVASGSRGGVVAVFVDEDGVRAAVAESGSAWEPRLATNSSGEVVLFWSRFESNSATGEAVVATGTFDAGFAPTVTLEPQSADLRGGVASSVAIDGHGNVAIAWAGHMATGTVDGNEQSTWSHQLLPGVLAPQVMIGGGQITVALGIYDITGSRCVALQQPIGGSLGPMIELGPCTSFQPVMTAMNESGLGVIVVNNEAYSDAGRYLSLMASVIPAGGEPAAPVELEGGGIDVRQNTLVSAVVDSSGVATIAWQAYAETALLPMTASMDLTATTAGVPATAREGTANRSQAISEATVATTRAAPDISYGTWTGGAISLASRQPGLLAAIWATNTTFTKANLSPTVTGLSPRTAPVVGGTTISVTGTRFVKDSVVYFGDVPATSVTYVSPTQLKVVAPAQAAGQVSVRVIAQGGSASSSRTAFVYGPAPSISALSPRLGKAAGGTEVTITGTGFVPGATVRFGTTAATNVRYLSSNTLIATAPKRAPGSVPVTVTTLAGTSPATSAGQFLYVNDDAGGMPTYHVSSRSQVEGNAAATNMTFLVTRTGSTGVAGSVKVATAAISGGATAGTDFTAKAPTLITFPVGTTSVAVTVSVKGDLVAEADESFRLVLSSPVNGDLATVPYGTGQILNDDSNAPTTLSIGDVSIVEGNSLTKNVTFTLTRSGSLAGTTTVKYQTVNGTAVAPGDYTAKTLTSLSFASGQATRTVTVAVRGDVLVEPDEAFFVTLSGAVGGSIADGTGRALVVNDDH